MATTPGMALVPAGFYADQARYMLNYGATLRTHRLKGVTGGTSAFGAAKRSAFARANYATFKAGKFTRPAAFRVRRAAYRYPFYKQKYGYKLERGLQGLTYAIERHPGRTRAIVYGGIIGGTAAYWGVKKLRQPKKEARLRKAGFTSKQVRVRQITLRGVRTRTFTHWTNPAGNRRYASSIAVPNRHVRAVEKRAARRANAAHGYKNTPPKLTSAQRRQMARKRRRVKGRFA